MLPFGQHVRLGHPAKHRATWRGKDRPAAAPPYGRTTTGKRAVGKRRFAEVAIFHFTGDVVSRSAGKSAIAKAAYIARERLTDERTGEAKDFRVAGGLLFSGIFLPKDAPEWAHDRQQLWNEAERAENRKDAQLARIYEIALPHELTDEQRRYLVQDFVKENFTRKGYAADVAMHAPDKEGDNRNYHAHILVTDRRLEKDGFAQDKKERQQTKREMIAELKYLRERAAHHTNRQLERYGHEARVDHRSLADQGIDREPTQHLGPTATELEREGKETERGNENREIKERNQDRAELREIEKELTAALKRQHEENRAKEGQSGSQGKEGQAKEGKIRVSPQFARAARAATAKPRRKWTAGRRRAKGEATRPGPTLPPPRSTDAEMWEDYRIFKAAGLLAAWRAKWGAHL